ncbi:MAG: hypothetical protein ACFCUU_13855 [Cyclobacteriaceae bacterium]
MLKKLVVGSIFFLVSGISFAQNFPSQQWHKGKVVLISEDTVAGLVKYDFENEMIQLNVNNSIQAFSARKILYFDIFDASIDAYRFFYALPYKEKNSYQNYEVPRIFEVLYEGKITLLAREEIVTETMPQYNYYYYRPEWNQMRNRLAYDFFFLELNGQIKHYNMKKKELVNMFGKHSAEIKQYMKKNRLKHDSLRDLVRITAYYNALVGKS